MNSRTIHADKLKSATKIMAKGFIASFLGMLVMACSGCGGGGGGNSPAPVVQTPVPQPNIQIVAMEQNAVMGRGPSGAWDDDDVLNPSIVQFNGALINYYSGWDGTVWRTGYATSADNGVTWTKRESPVLSLGAWDKSYIAANGSAIQVNGQVYYYFHGMTSAGNANIGLATSNDGVSFSALPNPVLTQDSDGTWDDLHVADPYVIKDGNRYLLYFIASDKNFDFTIGVATSQDGIAWQKHNGPVLSKGVSNDFDSFAIGEPAVVHVGQFYYMLYAATNSLHQRTLGWASSTDGIAWIKRGQLIPDSMRQAWDSQVICDPTILPTGNNDGTFYVWFGGGNQRQDSQNLDGQIGRMTIKISST